MKKILPFIFIRFTAALSKAQPVLDSGYLPISGASWTEATANDSLRPFLKPTVGANQAWDYSQLRPGGSVYRWEVLPFTVQGSHADINVHNIGNDYHHFYRISDTGYFDRGEFYPGNSILYLYTPILPVFPYGFSLGQQITQSSRTNYGPVGGYTIDDTCRYEGYGTLRLPNQMYSDVVQIRTIKNTSGDVDTTYSWYAPGIGHPLASHSGGGPRHWRSVVCVRRSNRR